MSGLAAGAFITALIVVYVIALSIPRILRWRERRHLDIELRQLLEAERKKKNR